MRGDMGIRARKWKWPWLALACLCQTAWAQGGSWDGLRQELQQLVEGKRAQVGIAVVVDGRDTLVVNNDVRYPMMSVFKFHQALAVADTCLRGGISFDSLVAIRRPVSPGRRGVAGVYSAGIYLAPERQQRMRHLV